MLDPYATKVLNREHHDRFVADIDNFALDAGIQKHWFWTPLDSTCGPEEIEYVRKFNATRAAGLVHGLCYVPLDKSPATPRPACTPSQGLWSETLFGHG